MNTERVWLAKDGDGNILCVSRDFGPANEAMVCAEADTTTLRQVLLVIGEPWHVSQRAVAIADDLETNLDACWVDTIENALLAERALARRDEAAKVEGAYLEGWHRGSITEGISPSYERERDWGNSDARKRLEAQDG